MGDNRGIADGRCDGSPGNFQFRENLQGRAFRTWGRYSGSAATTQAPTLLGEHSMINNVYLGRSQ
jgi:hypothetical protein